MNIKEARAAVASGRRQEWHYNGHTWTVEAQACGFKDGRAVARVWPVSGGAEDQRMGWSLFTLDDVRPMRELGVLCDPPRKDYRQPDLKLDIVFCQRERGGVSLAALHGHL